MLSNIDERPPAICFGEHLARNPYLGRLRIAHSIATMEVVMKKPFVALLLLLGATAMWAGSAFAQVDARVDGNKLVNASIAKKLMGARASHLGVSSLGGPETTWVGKSYTDHRAADNYWNIYVGDNLPGTATASNAIWDWDNTVGANAADSLWGWPRQAQLVQRGRPDAARQPASVVGA